MDRRAIPKNARVLVTEDGKPRIVAIPPKRNKKREYKPLPIPVLAPCQVQSPNGKNGLPLNSAVQPIALPELTRQDYYRKIKQVKRDLINGLGYRLGSAFFKLQASDILGFYYHDFIKWEHHDESTLDHGIEYDNDPYNELPRIEKSIRVFNAEGERTKLYPVSKGGHVKIISQ